MTAEIQGSPQTMTATVALSSPDWELRTTMTVPAGPTPLIQLLPLAQSFADAVVDSAAKVAEDQGQRITCKKGCGACCRQLVPLAEVEARHIGNLVNELPEPRRSEIRARFAEARRRLEEIGLLDRLLHPEGWGDGEVGPLGLDYFRLGIPCPFLEDESCSIYRDRPIACREYIVTSPAEHCARPTADSVQRVPLPLKVWTALTRFDEVAPSRRITWWVPLILAPEWAETHPDETPPRPGPTLLRELFDHLTKNGKAGDGPSRCPETPQRMARR